ncbi:MAG: HD domain-containing protein, partial [Fervidicoccaceae archaeon]
PPAAAESVAGHSFEAAVYALMLCRELSRKGFAADLGRALTLALLHDSEEALLGDVVKRAKLRARGLEEARLEALRELGLGELTELLREYAELSSVEGVIAKISDLLATANQAARYLDSGYRGVEDIALGALSELDSLLRGLRDEELGRALSEVIGKLVSPILRRPRA